MEHIRTINISPLLQFLFACQPGDSAGTDPSLTLDPNPTAVDRALDDNLTLDTKGLLQALSEAGADRSHQLHST